jgi:hypothetical protein
MGQPIKKHGLRGLMRRVTAKGLKSLDRRSAGYRALVEWRGELLRDLGGEESLSTQEKVLVDVALRTKLFLDHVDAWAMEQDSVVNRKRRCLYPVMAQRNALVNTLLNIMGQLGLKKREKSVLSLTEFLKRQEEGKHGDDDSTDDGERETVPADVSGARAISQG